MAVRIRKDGRILCAAYHEKQEGDIYIDDGLHYYLAVEKRILVSEPMRLKGGRGGHKKHGEWWWINEIPEDVTIEEW